MKKLTFGKGFTLLLLLVLVLPITACSPAAESFTVGIVNPAASMDPAIDAFKANMTERGYIEGENITYMYSGPLGADAATLDAEVQKFVDAKVDLIFSLATPGTAAAQRVTAGTGVPVVYTPISDPVGAGFAASYTAPGGNMTGVRVGGFVPKNLEWLVTIAPDIKKVYAPYNPKDQAAVYGRDLLIETAAGFGVEIVAPEAASADDIPGMIAEMPEDIDAIFILTDSMILSRVADFVAVSQERQIPLSSFSYSQVTAGTLMAYGPNFAFTGNQAARLADQVLQGADPGTLPVEEGEYFLYLNQAVADQIGITFPDSALSAATEIVR